MLQRSKLCLVIQGKTAFKFKKYAFIYANLYSRNIIMKPPWISSYTKLHTLFTLIGITVFYIIFGKLGLTLAFANASATSVWPPTGIAIATFLLFGYRAWPAIFIGAFVVNDITAGSILTSILIAIGNMLEGITAAYLIRRFTNWPHTFGRVKNVFLFFIFAIAATIVSATIGTGTLLTHNLLLPKNLQTVWLTWWLGDMGGALIVAPLILLWIKPDTSKWTKKSAIEGIFMIILLALVTAIVFSGYFSFEYMCIPVLVWIALRFRRKEAATAMLFTALLAIIYTLRGSGPFTSQGQNVNISLIHLQIFLCVTSLTTLIVAAIAREKRSAQLELTSREKLFKALVEKSWDAVVLIDATSKILYASPSAKKVLGYTPEELNGTTGFNLIIQEDRKKTMEELAKLVLKPGGTVTVEYRTTRKDKKVIWVEATGTNLLFDPVINAIVVNFRDITEKKQREDILKNEDKRFRALIEKGGEGLALVGKDGKVIYTTSTVTELLGYTQEEYEKIAQSIVHPDDLKMIQTKSVSFLKNPGKTISIEYRIMHKDGRYRWFNILATNLLEDEYVKAIVVRFRDITEEKIIEETERREKAEDEAVLESIGEGLIATDEKGVITLVNPAASRMLNVNISKLIGIQLIKAVDMLNENGEKLPSEERPMTKILTSKFVGFTSMSNYYVKSDGSKIPIAFTLTPVILDEKIIGSVEVFRDITEEKEIDRSKTEFVSLASHQLRTPLTTINWYTERLIGKKLGEMTLDQKRYLEEIYSAGRRMSNLINALLSVSRLELGTYSVEPEKISIPELSKQIIHEFLFQIKEKDLTLVEKYADNFPKINLDPKLIGIMIQNLLSNAIKYTQHGGKIEIDISYDQKNVKIIISDNGYGIPRKQQNKIFTKLFRADNIKNIDTDGTGLGLYLVKLLLDKFGGRISFVSKEKEGSTFTVLLPIEGMQNKKGTKHVV